MKKSIPLFILLLLFSFFGRSQQFISSIAKGKLSAAEVSALLGGLVNSQYGVQLYKLLYTTTNTQGILDTASGLLVIPDLAGGVFPFLVFERGTIDNRLDVPSNLQDAWEASAIAGSLGYVTVAPDLLGGGDSKGFHPYLHAASEATASLDMVIAAKAFLAQQNIQLNEQFFIAGYSQGGHSAMALHRLIETSYSALFQVTAAAHMSGPYSLSGVMRNLILSDEPYPFPGFVAYQMLAYNYVYHWYDSLAQAFKPQFIPPMEQFFREEIGFFEMDTLLLEQLRRDFGQDLPKLMFQDSLLNAFATDSLHPLNVALRENDTYNWAPQAPTRLFYCSGDDRVKFTNSIVADSVMRQNGARDIRAFDVSPLFNHRQCVEPAAFFAILFFENFKELVNIETIARHQLNIQAFPNPATSVLHLQSVPVEATIQLFDASGKIYFTQNVNTTTPAINLMGFNPGIYLLRVISGQRTWTGKIVKQ